MKSSLKLTAGFVCVILTALCQAGSLTPPAGTPAGTMKPLNDVEPRIAIHQSDMPKTISTSGSYYLAENVTTTTHGIIVSADDVTIDLSGFTLAGTGAGTTYGIYMSNRSNVEIRNGAVRGFSYGISEMLTTGKSHRVLHVRALSNKISGIYLSGGNCQIRDCTVTDTGVSAAGISVSGVSVGNGGVIANCTVTGTGTGATATSYIYGILTGNGGMATGNTVYKNGTSAAGHIYGIITNANSIITGNSVYNNGDSSTVGHVYGIYAYPGNVVTGNVLASNGSLAAGRVYGVYAGSGSTVSGNAAYYNGTSSTGDYVVGILTSSGCTVTGNSAYDNGGMATGIVYGFSLGQYNLVNNNTAYSNNGTNMQAGTGCVFGSNVAP